MYNIHKCIITVNVEIFNRSNFVLFLQAQQMLIFGCIKFRLWAWSVIPNEHDADLNVHVSTCCQCQNNV